MYRQEPYFLHQHCVYAVCFFFFFFFLFFFPEWLCCSFLVKLIMYVLVLLQTLTCLFFITLILSKYDNIAMWWLFADTEVA